MGMWEGLCKWERRVWDRAGEGSVVVWEGRELG